VTASTGTLTLMTRRGRLLIPLLLACVGLAATAPGAFAVTARYPTQSLGNRGSVVRAIQETLISKGYPMAFDGVFGTATRAAVQGFQAARGLPVTGIVNDATWDRLLTTLRPGSVGAPVRVLQRQLDEKRRAGLTVDGIYGPGTKAAVMAFQKHMGITATGAVSLQTWRWLLWHFELPSFNTTSLCDYSVGNGPANWGTAATIGQLEAAARLVASAGRGRVSVGDIGLEHGGDIVGHMTHEVGLDVDIRLMRDDRDQCRWGTNWHYASYDRTATRALIRAIRATAAGHVKLIYFNDPVLIKEGIVRAYPGHDDHLHVRYCEAGYPDVRYRC
jgi:peptidoglycan hydrolase-like protein with peptidoglycan-binding domain